MFKFTIRELLLLTLVVGLAVGWWLERRALVMGRRNRDAEIQFLRQHREKIQAELDKYKKGTWVSGPTFNQPNPLAAPAPKLPSQSQLAQNEERILFYMKLVERLQAENYRLKREMQTVQEPVIPHPYEDLPPLIEGDPWNDLRFFGIPGSR